MAMSDEQRRMLSMTARMEGTAHELGQFGEKKRISEMELVVLCNFAEIGLSTLLLEAMEGGEAAELEADLEAHIEAIRKQFTAGGVSGIRRLTQAAAALLRSERYMKYLAPRETA